MLFLLEIYPTTFGRIILCQFLFQVHITISDDEEMKIRDTEITAYFEGVYPEPPRNHRIVQDPYAMKNVTCGLRDRLS